MVSMPHWPIKFERFPHRIDLSPMQKLLEFLGDPHLQLPPIIHIAGTNGKGSTAATLKSIFNNAGYKAHLYTSPHIREFNERIVISDERISDQYLFALLERIREISERNSLDNSFFEITTALAFLAFAENPADITIIETGLGGRLDPTNIIKNPLATFITPISIEHAEHLGPNIEIIAREKAGIIKPNSTCIISAQTNEAFDVLLNKCDEQNANSIVFSYEYMIEKKDDHFIIEGRDFETEKFPFPNLLGDHQILNSSTIIAAILSKTFTGYEISKENIIDAIQNIDWPARLETVNYKGKKIILDGAHNESGAKILALWVKDNLKKGKISLILGMTNNRDAVSFVSKFKNIIDNIFTLQVRSEASSYMAEKLAQILHPTGINIVPCNDLDEAISKASENSDHIIVTGSLFLAADLYKLKG